MLSLQGAFQNLRQELTVIYSDSEATAVAHDVLEYITGKNKLQRLSDKETLLDEEQEAKYRNALLRLLLGEPLQYITNVQWFMGRPFYVDRNVLIPRPETEELVSWVIGDSRPRKEPGILDIGSGSGCIPVSLKLAIKDADVWSCDISEEALTVARRNAGELQAHVGFMRLDFLNTRNWNRLDRYDVIVSNPPYIPRSERDSLDKNVKDFEPETALFVPEDNVLLFYRAIALFGKTHLMPGGAIYCELHKDYAAKTKRLFEEMNYPHTELRKDMHGNERMLKIWLS